MSAPYTSGPRPSDKYIPWMIVGFFVFFIVLLSVFVMIATHGNPGVVTENAYQKGLVYNQTLAAAAEENKLRWRGDLEVKRVAQELTVTYVLHDHSGQPVNGARVELWLVRPTAQGMDQQTELLGRGQGRYRATLPLPALGLWQVTVQVSAAENQMQMTRRLVIK